MRTSDKMYEYEDDKYKLEIVPDEFHDNPREWSNFGKMLCWHDRYDLGDENEYETPTEFDEYIERLDKVKDVVILPLYLIDHGGIAMRTSSFGDPWDSGQVGYIYTTLEWAKEEFGREYTVDEIREYLINEVEIYTAFLSGNVWVYVISEKVHCNECGHNDHEVVDSCGGIFGTGSVVETMKGQADPEYHYLFDEIEV